MTKPLDDITVIEIDNWMAAPSAAAILADLGARVIKVEPLSGDPMRGLSRRPKVDDPIADHDFQFDVDNRGKESILLDLTNPRAIEIVRKLCQEADVFLCNLLKARQEKYALDPDSLKSVNPKLVHATLTGYGTEGPEAWRPGYDVTAFFGRSGLLDAVREGDEGVPARPATAQGDHTTGLALLSGILAALRLVERTGEFQVIETSLLETAVWTQATDYAATLVDRAPFRKRHRFNVLTATANRYPCRDGKWMMVNMPEPKWWGPFCDALDKPDWRKDERFISPRDRYQNMDAIVHLVDEVMVEKDLEEWGRIFDEHGVVWAAVQGIHEVTSDPQAEALGLFPTLQARELGNYRTVRAPINFHTAAILPERCSPLAGEQTVQILTELGFSLDEMEQLKSDKITDY